MNLSQNFPKNLMPLKKGDLVDIVCPSSPTTVAELEKIMEFLKKNGLRGRFFNKEKLLLKKKSHNLLPQSSAQLRFEQLHFALQQQDSKAIWCVRGGYGSAEIIPLLEKISPITQNKIFIGFSDLTALEIFLTQKWQWKIFYAPMLVQLASNKVSASAKKSILDFIFGKKEKLQYVVRQLGSNAKPSDKIFSAQIVGGCLSIVVASIGTENELNWQDKILFLEDVDESAERLDRYFWQLISVMKKTQIFPKAILLGNYKQGIAGATQKKDIDLVLKKFAQNLSCVGSASDKSVAPVFVEVKNCLGHSKNIQPLILG